MKYLRNTALILVIFLMVAAAMAAFSHGTPILAYHMVGDDPENYCIQPEDFDNQMQYLEEHGYTAIALDELLDGLEGRRPLPEKPVVITFDDGYVDNYTTALPILQKHGMRATVFVIAGLVGQPEYLSWEQIRRMHDQNIEIGSHTVSHVALTELDSARQQWEAAESRRQIEANLGAPVRFLAYPFGQFNSEVVENLRQAGYRGACSGITGLNAAGQDVFRLKRVNIPRPRWGMAEFRLRLWRAQLYSGLHL